MCRFGDPAKDKQAPLVKETSAVIFLDGRRQANFQTMMSEVSKFVKSCPGLYPKVCPFVAIRCMYHCREFEAGGSLSMTRRGLSGTAPDPLENMMLLLPKRYKPECRPIQQYNCDSYSRGWFGLAMKDKNGFDLTTLPEAAAALVHGGLKDDVKAAAVQGKGGNAEGEQQNQSGPPQDAPPQEQNEEEDDNNEEAGATMVAASHQLLWPWEAPVEFYSAVLEAFSLNPTPANSLLVDFTPGSGLAGLAACKRRVAYTAFAANEAHAKFIRATMCAKIVAEMILGDPSWSRKRYLSREESLTGTSSVRSPAPSLDAASPEPPAKQDQANKKAKTSPPSTAAPVLMIPSMFRKADSDSEGSEGS